MWVWWFVIIITPILAIIAEAKGKRYQMNGIHYVCSNKHFILFRLLFCCFLQDCVRQQGREIFQLVILGYIQVCLVQ